MDSDALLQIVDGHVLKVNGLGAINVSCIRENTDGHARTRDVREPANCVSSNILREEERDALDGTRETLITLGVVVLKTDLKLDRLDKVAALLALRVRQEVLDGAPHACH